MNEMGITIMNKKRTLRKLLSSGGMSIGETMIAVALIALLSLCIATGTAFGANQYQKSLLSSEARVLSSTLTSIFQEELSNTTQVRYQDGKFRYASPRYTPKSADPDNKLSSIISLDEEDRPVEGGFGQIALSAPQQEGLPPKYIRPLPSAAYAKSQRLKVRITVTPEDHDDDDYVDDFVVKMEFEVADKVQDQLETSFCVFPLNRLKLTAD